jgi:2-methylisocitrate lyase-like PEP mutase family enzyme
MRAIAEKHTVFKRLHQSGCFVLPNPWGGGSARLRERLGFVALTSTRAAARGLLAELTMTWRTASQPTFGTETGTGG